MLVSILVIVVVALLISDREEIDTLLVLVGSKSPLIGREVATGLYSGEVGLLSSSLAADNIRRISFVLHKIYNVL